MMWIRASAVLTVIVPARLCARWLASAGEYTQRAPTCHRRAVGDAFKHRVRYKEGQATVGAASRAAPAAPRTDLYSPAWHPAGPARRTYKTAFLMLFS